MSKMNTHDKHLYAAIMQYELDDPDSSFNFSERLARENNWTHEFALRTIFEYKRFMFLICISHQTLTPSEEVDQAWHLHLIYTYSYWEEFCKDVLKRPIHHGPTKGGKSERQKFDTFYNNTLHLYETTFGHMPPKDIWPPAHQRFRKSNIVKVDKQDYWLIKKPL